MISRKGSQRLGGPVELPVGGAPTVGWSGWFSAALETYFPTVSRSTSSSWAICRFECPD